MKAITTACLMAICVALLSSCAIIPNGGYSDPVKTLGIPGPVLGTVQVGEGLLVQTVMIDDHTALNIQINEDKVANDPLLFDNVLTIGKFSKVLGSGFSKKKDIVYRKRIHESGKDSFALNDRKYLVTWECNYKDARTYLVPDHYTVAISQLFPILKAETPIE